MKPLKILLLSHSFTPTIGGIEASSELIAEALTRRGYEVILMTMTPGGTTDSPYKIIRILFDW